MYYDTYFKLYDFEKPLVLEPSDIVDHIDMRKVEEKNLKGFMMQRKKAVGCRNR